MKKKYEEVKNELLSTYHVTLIFFIQELQS